MVLMVLAKVCTLVAYDVFHCIAISSPIPSSGRCASRLMIVGLMTSLVPMRNVT